MSQCLSGTLASSPRARRSLEQVSILDLIFVLHTSYDLDSALQDLVRLILFSGLKKKKATMKSALSQRAFSQRAIQKARMKTTELRARAVRALSLSVSVSTCVLSRFAYQLFPVIHLMCVQVYHPYKGSVALSIVQILTLLMPFLSLHWSYSVLLQAHRWGLFLDITRCVPHTVLHFEHCCVVA